MYSKTSLLSIALLASSQLVAGHSAIVKAVGDAGGQGSAIGIDPNTPRDGTNRNPFQQDSTRFRGDAADSCGETLGGGTNDIETGTAKVMQLNGATLPQVSAGGSVMMTLHQVNGDGAGPYTCMIDSTGTGAAWTQTQVTTNVDGNARGRNNDNSKTDLPLNVAIPADQTCTGTVAGQSNVCMVRCQNPARAGPFGGCVPVQMAGANTTAAAGAAQPAAGAAGAQAPAAGAAGTQPAAQAQAPAAGAAGSAQPAAAQPAAAQAGAQGTAGTAGTVPAANAPAANAAAANVPAAGAATGQTLGATGATGAAPATGATVAKREPKLELDADDEEVNPAGQRTTINFPVNARYVVTDN